MKAKKEKMVVEQNYKKGVLNNKLGLKTMIGVASWLYQK